MAIFVSAVYKIYNRPYAEEIWERIYALTEFFELRLFISTTDAYRITNHSNIIPYYKEFNTLETYAIINETQQLPTIRSMHKDTREYMILMNAKTEMMRIVKNTEDATHYVWLDAGLSKIFIDPAMAFDRFRVYMQRPLITSHILIPGCWRATQNIEKLIYCINWRFCGGFFIVPHDLIDLFAQKVLDACADIRDITDTAIWEVNVWAYIEPQLPILWTKGDHDDSMLLTIEKYFL